MAFGSPAAAYAARNAPRLAFAGADRSHARRGGRDRSGERDGHGLRAHGGQRAVPDPARAHRDRAGVQNRTAIADDVLPRLPVGTKEFKYLVNTQSEGFTIPDTKVGRRSSPGQVEFTATEVAGFCQDYGLDDVIPQDDIDNAPPNYDPVGRATRCSRT
jgi:hypothetical protein